MSARRTTCEEVIRGRPCGAPAGWVVGLAADGLYVACDRHARAWAPECRDRLDPQTSLQRAIVSVIGAYVAACTELTASEGDVLRDVIACRLARDYAVALGELDGLKERVA